MLLMKYDRSISIDHHQIKKHLHKKDKKLLELYNISSIGNFHFWMKSPKEKTNKICQ